MSNVIRWGIIGCGSVCEVNSGPAFRKCAGSALVAVMRRDAAKAQDFARRHSVPKWYDDADKLIQDDEVDAVYVATPPGAHEQYALRIAAAGKPCYVEKPMARSYVECARMIEAFRAAGKPLFVAYYRRALPRFVRAKQVIDSGGIGRVTGCTYRHTRLHWPNPAPEWRLDPEQSGGGLLLDLGGHTLDILDWLLGEFTEFGGSASNFSSNVVEDAVSLHFKTSRSAVGTASWNFAGASKEDLLTIDGTEGRVLLSTFDEDLRIETKAGREELTIPNPLHVQQPLVQSIVDELLGRGVCPSTGETAARTSRVMDAALAAYYGGRADAFWTRARARRGDSSSEG
jgi:predicted dehydrogenase